MISLNSVVLQEFILFVALEYENSNWFGEINLRYMTSDDLAI